MMIQQKINSKFIKLDQLLKLVGVAQTGGQAKQIILDQKIKLNQEVCTTKGKKIYNGDIIKYESISIEVISDV